MIREKIESVEDKVLDTAAMAMVSTENTLIAAARNPVVRKVFSKKGVKIANFMFTACIMVGIMAINCFASADPDETFNTLIDTFKTWIPRIAVVIIAFGGVTAGIGVANQDDAGRNRGLMTCAGGAVVAAVGEIMKAG